MALTYRKSVRLPGGFRLNVSSRGVGASAGAKGVRYSSRSGLRVTVPGTGITWRAGRRKKSWF